MDEDAMWKGFYQKIIEDKELKEKNNTEKTEHEKRIQESDGGFFENLGTLLAEKARALEEVEGKKLTLPILYGQCQNEKKYADDKEEKDEENETIVTEALLESDSDRDENEEAIELLNDSVGWNIEELYTALVYMTHHQIGYDDGECGNEVLLNHLQQAFKVDNEMHLQIVEETQKMEAPVMHLNVEVIEAKELVSKDSNGKSDPFCALYLESAPTRRYNTAVKSATLTPVWEEHFELPLEDTENDTLCLEVWDFDAAETVPEKMSKVKDIKGVRGFVKLAKEIAVTATSGSHDNEFIGRCRISLKDIPVTGHTTWYSLEKKNKTKRRGVVKLKLIFSAEHNTQVAAQEHRHLIRILLLHEIDINKIEKYCWSGCWSSPAEVLIQQHIVQRGLLLRNVSLAQWIEYSKIHQQHPLNYSIFNKLAIELLRPLENGLFSNDEIKLFWDSTKKIIYSCLNSIRKIRRLTGGDRNAVSQVGSILGILSSVSSIEIPQDFDLFPRKMFGWLPQPDGTDIDIIKALEYTVIQGGIEWFDDIMNKNLPQLDSDDNALKYYIKIIQLIRADLQNAIETYDKLFIKKINFPYARTLYVMYEKRISDMCKIIIGDVCLRLKSIKVKNDEINASNNNDSNNDSDNNDDLTLGTILFELYLTLQRYAVLSSVFCLDGLDEMSIQKYHEWFDDGVSHWLDIAVYKAIKRIKKAVEFDTLKSYDTIVQYSSSAVDTLTIFYQIKVFWTQLAWPDVEGSYAFIMKILSDIGECSKLYAGMMEEKAEKVHQQIQQNEKNTNTIYDKKFQVSIAWCYAINNIDYIKTSIEPLANDLGFRNIINSLDEIKTKQESDRCRESLQRIIDEAKDNVNHRIDQLLEVVAYKMQPSIERYLMTGAEIIDTKNNTLEQLLMYLNSNLDTLYKNLNDDNFNRILDIILDVISQTVDKLIDNNIEKRRPPSFFSNLHRALTTLLEFFKGGANEQSKIPVLEKNEPFLQLLGMETSELIHLYYLQRLEQQNDNQKSSSDESDSIEKSSDEQDKTQIFSDESYKNRKLSDEQNKNKISSHGQLAVNVYIIQNTLVVQIFSVFQLNPNDCNGKCDPYVKIRLMPEEKFCDLTMPKTHVENNTFCPIYDKTFNIPLSDDQKNTKDAILIFEVKDKEGLLTRPKFMAEAFLRFSEIPNYEHESEIEREQVRLPLSRPVHKNTDVIRTLEYRKGDTQAMGFISKLNSRISNSK
ncbi:hypothetical protein HCN44_006656 [Aphidius gifuensis]|uniref:Uncharacterized protein n=1 Tax=Aphidius gifuensis TaxID=684658 RepID=A0A835CT14_APHGI|nr:protein unc-13 homolog 4B isoform X2 [Aphidius gifuensis]KAF7995549.1 hypothetical protein HCN44_006656 [Aphidius gifuensis]